MEGMKKEEIPPVVAKQIIKVSETGAADMLHCSMVQGLLSAMIGMSLQIIYPMGRIGKHTSVLLLLEKQSQKSHMDSNQDMQG